MTPPRVLRRLLIPHRMARPAGAGTDRPAPVPASEHATLTAGTADLWRELAHLCMETPL